MEALGKEIGTGVICFSKSKNCGPCTAQKAINDEINTEDGNKIHDLQIDVNDVNKQFSKTVDIKLVPSFLFFKDGEVIMAKDPSSKGEFVIEGYQDKKTLKKIFSLMEKYPDKNVFDIVLRKNCIACRFNSISLLHKMDKNRISCGLFWRSPKFNIYK